MVWAGVLAVWRRDPLPRPPRADEVGGLHHTLNRANLRATVLHKDADYEAFERILSESLQIYRVNLFLFHLIPNHCHLVLRPLVDGEMRRYVERNALHAGLVDQAEQWRWGSLWHWLNPPPGFHRGRQQVRTLNPQTKWPAPFDLAPRSEIFGYNAWYELRTISQLGSPAVVGRL